MNPVTHQLTALVAGESTHKEATCASLSDLPHRVLENIGNIASLREALALKKSGKKMDAAIPASHLIGKVAIIRGNERKKRLLQALAKSFPKTYLSYSTDQDRVKMSAILEEVMLFLPYKDQDQFFESLALRRGTQIDRLIPDLTPYFPERAAHIFARDYSAENIEKLKAACPYITSIKGSEYVDDAVPLLRRHKNLERLDVNAVSLREARKGDLKRITHLKLRYCEEMTDKELKLLLKKCPGLTELELHSYREGEGSTIYAEIHLPKLKRFISDSKVGYSCFCSLRDSPFLEALIVPKLNLHWGDEEFEVLQGFHHLKELDICFLDGPQYKSQYEKFASVIKQLRHLTYLACNGRLKSEIIEAISSLPHLTTLELDGKETQIRDDVAYRGVSALAENSPALDTIFLKDVGLSFSVLEKFYQREPRLCIALDGYTSLSLDQRNLLIAKYRKGESFSTIRWLYHRVWTSVADSLTL